MRQSRVELMTLQTIAKIVRTSQKLELDRLITNSKNNVTKINAIRFTLWGLIILSCSSQTLTLIRDGTLEKW